MKAFPGCNLPEGGGRIFLRIVGIALQDYKVSQQNLKNHGRNNLKTDMNFMPQNIKLYIQKRIK
jgi:hypothetical protein